MDISALLPSPDIALVQWCYIRVTEIVGLPRQSHNSPPDQAFKIKRYNLSDEWDYNPVEICAHALTVVPTLSDRCRCLPAVPADGAPPLSCLLTLLVSGSGSRNVFRKVWSTLTVWQQTRKLRSNMTVSQWTSRCAANNTACYFSKSGRVTSVAVVLRTRSFYFCGCCHLCPLWETEQELNKIENLVWGWRTGEWYTVILSGFSFFWKE